MRVSATTRFIISTSGRPKSLRRYHRLLQELLGLDVAYMPISAGGSPGGKINPASFVAAIKGMNCVRKCCLCPAGPIDNLASHQPG